MPGKVAVTKTPYSVPITRPPEVQELLVEQLPSAPALPVVAPLPVTPPPVAMPVVSAAPAVTIVESTRVVSDSERMTIESRRILVRTGVAVSMVAILAAWAFNFRTIVGAPVPPPAAQEADQFTESISDLFVNVNQQLDALDLPAGVGNTAAAPDTAPAPEPTTLTPAPAALTPEEIELLKERIRAVSEEPTP